MSGGGGGGDTSTSTEPWSQLQGPLRDLYRGARQFSNTPTETFGDLSPVQRHNEFQRRTGLGPRQLGQFGLPGDEAYTAVTSGGFVPFLPQELQAQQGAINLAGQGIDPTLTAAGGAIQGATGARPDQARDFLSQTAGGEFLGSNPFLDATYQAATEPYIEQFNTQVLPGISAQFGGTGNFDSSARQFVTGQAARDLQRQTGNIATNLYGNAYNQERGFQEQARGRLADYGLQGAALAPGVAGAGRGQQLSNLDLLQGVGGAQRGLLGDLVQRPAAAFDIQQQEPLKRYAQLASIYSGGNAFNTQTTPYYGGSPLAGGLGGALGGATLGAPSGPFGALAGGLGGGFLGSGGFGLF